MDKQPRKARRSSGSHSTGKESKNVSHVPCKFYRQGVCQAGDNCPFSHAEESTAQTVCKYFQKGNCKFGAKCALAHITPDGRRVPKDKKKKEAPATSNATHIPGAGERANSTGSILNTPATVGAISIASPIGSNGTHLPLSPPSAPGGAASSVGAISAGSPLSLPMLNRPSTTGSSRAGSFHFESSLFPSRSGSTSTSRAASIWADRPKNPMAFEGSAVTDDDDDGFEEDLVPGALSELLTPQERERRNSRHLSNSQGREISTDLWSQRVFHRGSFGRSDRPEVRPEIRKVEPIGPGPIRD